MSEQEGITAASIGTFLDATFDGATPSTIATWVNPELCAELIGDAKLGFVFSLGETESPRIRLAKDDEPERFATIVGEAFPAAKGFLATHAEDELVAETDGASLRIFSIYDEPKGTLHGMTVMGELWTAEGTTPIVAFDKPPTDKLSAAQAASYELVISRGGDGQWMGLPAEDGTLASLFWITEQPYRIGSTQIVESFGGGPRLTALRAAIEAEEAQASPYMVEWPADGPADVCAWGVGFVHWWDDIPEVLVSGEVPDAAAYADLVAAVVPEEDADEVRSMMVKAYADRMALVDDGNQNAALVAHYGFLCERISQVTPYHRLETIREMNKALRLAVLERQIAELALARFFVERPEIELDDTLPMVPRAEFMALSVEEIKAKSAALKEEFETYSLWLEEIEDLHEICEKGFKFFPRSMRDHLARTQSGDFTGGAGVLIDVLEALGPGGYEDDPELAHLEDVDLDPADRDRALEEALAAGFEDEDEDF